MQRPKPEATIPLPALEVKCICTVPQGDPRPVRADITNDYNGLQISARKRLTHAFLTVSQSKEVVVANLEAIEPISTDSGMEDSIGDVGFRLSLARLGGSSEGSAFCFNLGSRCSGSVARVHSCPFACFTPTCVAPPDSR